MKRHIAYLKYLIRHKWFVLVAGIKIGCPLWRLLTHDLSKFRPSEWFAYVAYFYGTQYPSVYTYYGDRRNHILDTGFYKENIKEKFEFAWLHHQHRNLHHWQYWLLKEDDGDTKVLEMPEKYVFEMVADWMGAGRAISGKWDFEDWYTKNKSKIVLHEESQLLAEKLMIEFKHKFYKETEE